MKTTNKRGFSLISFMVYLTMCTTIVILSAQALIRLTTHFFARSSEVQHVVDTHLLLDAIARDLYYAPQNVNLWQTFKRNHIVYKSNNALISWQTKNGALSRTIKKFNVTQNKWKRGHTTTLLPVSAHLLFIQQTIDDDTSSIAIQLTYHNHTITRSVVPRGV